MLPTPTPFPAIPDNADAWRVHAKPLCQSVLRLAQREEDANTPDLNFSQFVQVVPIPACCSSFSSRIVHVVRLRSSRQMPWVTTRRIIALVHNKWRPFSRFQKERNSMCSVSMGFADGEVTVSLCSGMPSPARIWIVSAPNIRPESSDVFLSQGWWVTLCVSHWTSFIGSVVRGCRQLVAACTPVLSTAILAGVQ